jgi:acyclic terpene utilization AtuA family protein
VIVARVEGDAVGAQIGAPMHEFGWRADAYDLLAAGSLAGHIVPRAIGRSLREET